MSRPDSKPLTYIGRVDHVSAAHAFIVVDSLAQDPMVAHRNLAGAQHSDVVEIAFLPSRERGRDRGRGSARGRGPTRREARVVKILERVQQTLVGKLEVAEGGGMVVVPDHKRFHHAVQVAAAPDAPQGKVGDKAVVAITAWPTPETLAVGKLTKVLGPAGSHRAETVALMEQFGFDEHFDEAIEAYVNGLPATIAAEEIARRRDFRKVTTLTIDPDDAKDFDDALSFRQLPDGLLEVGIHIADVTHYVKEGTPLDKEALRRGTSAYLVGHTVPMLPERLANNLCSLRPEEERLAFAAVVTLEMTGKVHDLWVGETVIYSDKRFTYEEAQGVLDAGEGPYHEELATLHTLAKTLRKARMAQGAIAFTSRDIKIHLDEAGEPVSITPKLGGPTHQLIEEFMLLANRLVATKIYKQKRGKEHPPFIYRTHEVPDATKVADLARFAGQLGYRFKQDPETLPQSFNQLLKAVEGTHHQDIVQSQAIRTMSQALYTTEAKPHFGLAFAHYTHFTSPIRRYPDVLVHRLLKHYAADGQWPDRAHYADMARQSAGRERMAVEAERASINFKQVAFMQDKVGQQYDGIITGITAWGIYVELTATRCEGMARLAAMKDDYYIFDSERFCLRGKRTRRTYKLGDEVRVQVDKCDLDCKTMDLMLVTR